MRERGRVIGTEGERGGWRDRARKSGRREEDGGREGEGIGGRQSLEQYVLYQAHFGIQYEQELRIQSVCKYCKGIRAFAAPQVILHRGPACPPSRARICKN